MSDRLQALRGDYFEDGRNPVCGLGTWPADLSRQRVFFHTPTNTGALCIIMG